MFFIIPDRFSRHPNRITIVPREQKSFDGDSKGIFSLSHVTKKGTMSRPWPIFAECLAMSNFEGVFCKNAYAWYIRPLPLHGKKKWNRRKRNKRKPLRSKTVILWYYNWGVKKRNKGYLRKGYEKGKGYKKRAKWGNSFMAIDLECM